MAKKHKPEEIVAKLRQVDVLTSQGMPIADAIRSIGVTEVTYYRWRNEYGGLKSDQVKRLKDLETENARLRKAISDLTLDKQSCRRLPGEITEPCASACLHRACSLFAWRLRASRLCGARTAPLDTAQDAAGPRRQGAADSESSSLPDNTAATATARSRLCCATPAGL